MKRPFKQSSITALLTDDIPYRKMRKKMTKKSLFGNRAVYVAMMDIRMDMVVTRAAYRRPHDNLWYNIKT